MTIRGLTYRLFFVSQWWKFDCYAHFIYYLIIIIIIIIINKLIYIKSISALK